MTVRAAGFTLIEVLVALALSALVAVMAYSGVSSALLARDALAAEEEQLRQMQTFFQLIGRDLRHLHPRPIVNEYDDLEPALRSVFGEPVRLSFTRNGWQNVADATRSTLQRVVWRIEDEQLQRGYWPVLDRSGELPPIERVVVDGVLELDLRFLDLTAGAPRWSTNWPADEVTPEALPVAIEVTLETRGMGRVQRLFLPNES